MCPCCTCKKSYKFVTTNYSQHLFLFRIIYNACGWLSELETMTTVSGSDYAIGPAYQCKIRFEIKVCDIDR